MKYLPDKPPTPLLESSVRGKFRYDTGEYVPQGGFIADFVLYTRGIETPTKFAVWSALMGVSIILKRDAYMDWFPKPLYPNLFLMLVAPPRICAKTTCVEIAADIIELLEKVFDNPKMKAGKSINAHRGKATPEMLFDLMKAKKVEIIHPEEGPVEGPDPEDKTEEFIDKLNASQSKALPPEAVVEESFQGISEISLIIDELTTFLGKQKYNETLVDILTHFYDCPNRADEATRSYGAQTLENVYLTFFGATTPDAFNSSLPETAFGGGFLSRTIISANYLPTRSFPMPSLLEGAPSEDEIAERLAWIASTALGGYVFSKEAYDEYVKWYHVFKESLVGDPLADARARMDTNLIKLCVILRAQRYERGNVIARQDFLDAKYLITEALESSRELYSGANGSEYYTQLQMISRYVEKKTAEGKPPTRATLIREFTVKKITPELLTKLIGHLMQSELVEVTLNGGPPLITQSEHPMEQIHFKEPTDE